MNLRSAYRCRTCGSVVSLDELKKYEVLLDRRALDKALLGEDHNCDYYALISDLLELIQQHIGGTNKTGRI